jgi:hypothetical protein
VAVFKFNLKYLELQLCDDGNRRIANHYYSGFQFYLDKSVYDYLENCRLLTANNNMFLVVETGDEEYWRITPKDNGKLWGCVVGGKIIIKPVEKITKILCTEANLNFKTPGDSRKNP